MKSLGTHIQILPRALLSGFLLCVLMPGCAGPVEAALTLQQAVMLAQRHDPWLAGSEFRQHALAAQSTAAGTLPDPVLSLGFANLPTDNFEFDQEAMTQFKIGVSQVFPRGNSLALNQRRLALLGAQYPHQRDDRRATVAVNISHLWLETFRSRETIRLIEQDRELFEHLVDVAQSSYASALGRTRQQDLVRAQLELTRLEDRLTVLHERRDMFWTKLAEWLRDAPAAWSDSGSGPLAETGSNPGLADALPDIELRHASPVDAATTLSVQQLAVLLKDHPAIQSLDRRIDASEAGVELAEQKYRPQWSVNASYGYREDDPMGDDRPDFFSVGVSFDLPLFTSRRQDQQVQAAVASTEALRTEKWLLLRNMIAAFETQRSRLRRLDQRWALYQSRLLREMREQAEASLTAYTNDDGDFSEVVRARIAGLNARIEAHDIQIDRLKTIVQLNYFFTASGARVTGESS